MDNEPPATRTSPAWFEPTRWSVVLESAKSEAPGARSALAELCKAYWQPLYAFARRRGYDHHRSQDLIQGFFLSLIASKSLSRVDPHKGKFRSYLLASLQNHMASEHTRETAQKRGGGMHFVSLDDQDAGVKFDSTQYANTMPAEVVFEREWAVAAVEAALARLEEDFAKRGKREVFLALKPYLIGDQPQGAYDETAAALNLSPGAIRTGVHRLRHEFRLQLRREVAKTVESPDQIEDEMRHLRTTLGNQS
ncbi:MAG TPA: ECF-type sigma factor [Opitutaceae bacterium]|nr:ECF-type sigma factor [Opitutaceae bacterium]